MGREITTFDNEEKALATELDGVSMPAEITFSCVNCFVHSLDTSYEDLQALCLFFVSEIEKLNKP